MEDLLQVGVITSTHGIRGEVKVFPTTDDAARFKKLKNVILDNGKERRDLEITSVKFFKNQVILKFKGIDDINDVEKYKKAPLFVTRENAVPLEENEYFIADLIGLSVHALLHSFKSSGSFHPVVETALNISFPLASFIRFPSSSRTYSRFCLLPHLPSSVKGRIGAST